MPDIIHSNISCGFAFKRDLPLVVTAFHFMHDSDVMNKSSIPQKAYYRLLWNYENNSLRKADLVTCISKYTKYKLEELFEYSDSKMIYPGINYDLFSPKCVSRDSYGMDEKKIILLFVGNMSTRKGADLLPKIMEKLSEKYLLLTTAGLRGCQNLTNNKILNLGRLGINELINIYNLSDMLLFPSRLEGFGYAVAEAMSCEKPIVTTNYSSLPELVIHEKGGFLCKKNCIDDFVEKINILGDDCNLRNKMGHFNREIIIEKFGYERMAIQYARIYNNI